MQYTRIRTHIVILIKCIAFQEYGYINKYINNILFKVVMNQGHIIHGHIFSMSYQIQSA